MATVQHHTKRVPGAPRNNLRWLLVAIVAGVAAAMLATGVVELVNRDGGEATVSQPVQGDGLTTAQAADAARLTGLAEFYANNEIPGAGIAVEPELTDIWEIRPDVAPTPGSQAEPAAQAANAARLTGLAEFYGGIGATTELSDKVAQAIPAPTPETFSPELVYAQRAPSATQTTDAARLTGLAEFYRGIGATTELSDKVAQAIPTPTPETFSPELVYAQRAPSATQTTDAARLTGLAGFYSGIGATTELSDKVAQAIPTPTPETFSPELVYAQRAPSATQTTDAARLTGLAEFYAGPEQVTEEIWDKQLQGAASTKPYDASNTKPGTGISIEGPTSNSAPPTPDRPNGMQ